MSELAEKKFYLLLDHLQEEWGRKVRDNFVATFINKSLQISQNPKSCPKSIIKEGVYKCVLTKQTTFYYTINFKKQNIEIITFFDSRQSPDNLVV